MLICIEPEQYEKLALVRDILVPDDDEIVFGAPGVSSRGFTVLAGALKARVESDALYVTGLVVDTYFRNRGIATKLLSDFIVYSRDNLLMGEIVFLYPENEYTEICEHIMSGLGFGQETDGGLCFSSTVGDLRDIAELRAGKGSGYSCIPLTKLTDRQISLLERKVAESGVSCGIRFPLERERYLPDSIACLSGEGKLAGLIAISGGRSGINIDWIYMPSRNPAVLSSLISRAVGSLKKNYPPETGISFTSLNSTSIKMGEKMLSEYTSHKLKMAVLDVYGH